MDKKKEYSKFVGLGLVLGAAIGSILDFSTGTYKGMIAAAGAGLGLVIGAIIGHYKISLKKKIGTDFPGVHK